MSPRLLLGLGLALAGCAAPVALDAPADHPARPDAPTAALAIEASALPPVSAPRAPAPLRSMPEKTPMMHGASHGAHSPAPASTDAAPLDDAVAAYLAVHYALASDRLDPDAAAAFATAVAVLTEMAPADDPHLWHRQPDAVDALRASARALAQAADLDAAREAFGVLGPPFADVVEALGAPGDLVRHTCAMTDAPQRGVWLQRAGPARNPYFGTGMLTCSRRADEVPAHHGAMDHGAMDHEGTR